MDLVLTAMLASCAVTGFLADRLVRRQEKTCTGYAHFRTGEKPETKHDCLALRNPMCSDGRCKLHCRELCKCDP